MKDSAYNVCIQLWVQENNEKIKDKKRTEEKAKMMKEKREKEK